MTPTFHVRGTPAVVPMGTVLLGRKNPSYRPKKGPPGRRQAERTPTGPQKITQLCTELTSTYFNTGWEAQFVTPMLMALTVVSNRRK